MSVTTEDRQERVKRERAEQLRNASVRKHKPIPAVDQRWAWVRGDDRREYIVELAEPPECGLGQMVHLRRTDGPPPHGIAYVTAHWMLVYDGEVSGTWEPI